MSLRAHAPEERRAHPEYQDPRVTLSRASLKRTLTQLAVAQDPATISVAQLCREAGVSRPTFYQHFEDVDSVFGAILQDRFEEAEQEYLRTAGGDEDAVRTIAEMIRGLDEQQDMYRRVIGAASALPKARHIISSLIREKFAVVILGREFTELEADEAQSIRFISGGIVSLLGARVEGTGPQQSPEQLATKIQGWGHVVVDQG